MATFNFIDLFAGIGGFRIGAEMNGGTCVGYSEIDNNAIRYYTANFGDAEPNYGDITKIESMPYVDLLTGGVPCQSWSIAGKKLGFDDSRGRLWDNTIDLLEKVRPKVFIFENVKGLSDPRNREAMDYITGRIHDAGYKFHKCVLNSNDFGTPQERVRMYLVGFRDPEYWEKFHSPEPYSEKLPLCHFLDGVRVEGMPTDGQFSLNDQRGSDNTVHSWDIIDTTPSEKHVCELILKNRRKKAYGEHDGNPMSFDDLSGLDPEVKIEDILSLCRKGILKEVPFEYRLSEEYIMFGPKTLCDKGQQIVLSNAVDGIVRPKTMKNKKNVKLAKLNIDQTIASMVDDGILDPTPKMKYDLVNAKISSGINGVYRIMLPGSTSFPTLVASGSIDMVATRDVTNPSKECFISEIYEPGEYRQITKAEACRLQGFPDTFVLPESRNSWMKLIGNSVVVNVINNIVSEIVATGVFGDERIGETPAIGCGKNEPISSDEAGRIANEARLDELMVTHGETLSEIFGMIREHSATGKKMVEYCLREKSDVSVVTEALTILGYKTDWLPVTHTLAIYY